MWTKPEVARPPLRRDVPAPRNLLLESLSGYDYDRLLPMLERVPLVPRRVLQHARMPVQHLYLIEEGLVSVLANADEQQGVEVWLIGREGVVGSPAVLGVSASPLLGVRRATVSEAITSLEREGVLERVRGEVRICDRDRLEQLSCRCYRVIRQEQERPLRPGGHRIPLLSLPAMCVLLAES